MQSRKKATPDKSTKDATGKTPIVGDRDKADKKANGRADNHGPKRYVIPHHIIIEMISYTL
jgi:hypothetical protein